MRLLALVLVLVLAMGAPAFGQQRIANGWSWAGIASATLENQSRPAPAPAPKPKPGDICPACGGSGRVGDGRVSQTCRDCNGTGKVVGQAVSAMQQKAADMFLPPLPAAQPIQSSQPAQVQNCPGGVCPLPSQSRASTYIPPQPTTVRRGWIFKR